jgi:hypothetical protein
MGMAAKSHSHFQPLSKILGYFLFSIRKTNCPVEEISAAGGVRTLAGILDAIDKRVTRCDATETISILDAFKAFLESGKVEAKPDITPAAYEEILE